MYPPNPQAKFTRELTVMLLLQQLCDWWQRTLVLSGANTGDAADGDCVLCGRAGHPREGLQKARPDTRHAPLVLLYPKPS